MNCCFEEDESTVTKDGRYLDNQIWMKTLAVLKITSDVQTRRVDY